MKVLIIYIFSFFILNFVNAFENKIIIKIENEIITSVDLENEKKYLTALNPNIKNLENNKLNIISKNSLVREKIKENEILKYVETIKLDENFLNELIRQRYSRLNLNNKNQFINYINNYNLDIGTIEKKISIEALWNQLIYQKFSKNVKINEEKLKEQIKIQFQKNEKNFLLSEIVFKVIKKENLKKKYNEILESINIDGFESAALSFSISDSSNVGGKLGWIKQSSLNKEINNKLKNLDEGDISKPIFTPNGYMILKIDKIKFIKKKYNEDFELNELIKQKTNQQLNQQSIIYFNKIKKNTNINEL